GAGQAPRPLPGAAGRLPPVRPDPGGGGGRPRAEPEHPAAAARPRAGATAGEAGRPGSDGTGRGGGGAGGGGTGAGARAGTGVAAAVVPRALAQAAVRAVGGYLNGDRSSAPAALAQGVLTMMARVKQVKAVAAVLALGGAVALWQAAPGGGARADDPAAKG